MKGDINDTLRNEGTDAVRARHDRAQRYNGGKSRAPNGANGRGRPGLRFLDISDWDTAAVPPREWAVQDRIPLRQVSLLSGEGAIGGRPSRPYSRIVACS